MLYRHYFPLRPVMASWLAAGVVLFSGAGNAAGEAHFYQFKAHKAPELNVFHPQGFVSVELKWLKDFQSSESGGIFRVCSGKEWIGDTQNGPAPAYKQKDLWKFITPAPGPEDQEDIDPNYVRLKLELGTPYVIRLPLHVPTKNFKFDDNYKSDYQKVSLAARSAYPFAADCNAAPGVIQDMVEIKIPVPSLKDSTPEVPDLNSQQVKLTEDKKNMTVTVPVFGASQGNTTVAWCDTDKPCDKEHQGVAMTRGEEMKNAENLVTGAKYSVTLPVPVKRGYTASIKVTKQVSWPQAATVTREFPMITNIINTPQAKLLNCTNRQCTFQWRSVLPYRNQNGSLGINFQGLKPLNGPQPGPVFSLHPDSWEDTDLKLFAGQSKESLSVSNWQHYDQNKNQEFLTPDLMPREGVFIVRFEPKAQ